MVLGRDAAQLGGLQVQSNWLANSDTSACGKLAVLERLLDLWRKDATNKVRAFLQSHMCCKYGEWFRAIGCILMAVTTAMASI